MSMFKKSKIISIQYLAKMAGVPYWKIYNRKTGSTERRMDLADRTKLANALQKELMPIFKDLGFTITIQQVQTEAKQEA